MGFQSGLQRIKVTWAVLCIVIGLATAALVATGVETELALEVFVGISFAAISAAIIPFLNIGVAEKVILFLVCTLGGTGYADKGINSAIAAVVWGVVLWGIIRTVGWIIKGFSNRD